MGKKTRPDRNRGKDVQVPDGIETQGDSGSAGSGSPGRGIWVNERGETCIGNECFQMAVDTERNEIRVNVRKNATCDVNPIIESLRKSLTKGARTIYEVEVEPED